MQPPTDSEKLDQVRKLIFNLSRFIEPLWANDARMTRLRRFEPDRLENFWQRWDELDTRCQGFIEGLVPYRITESEEGIDVLSAARSLFLLVFELVREYEKESSSSE